MPPPPPRTRGSANYTTRTTFVAETGVGTVILDVTDWSRRVDGYLSTLDHDKDQMIRDLMESVAGKVMERYQAVMERDHKRPWDGTAGGKYLAGDEGQGNRFGNDLHTAETAEAELLNPGFRISVGNAGHFLEEGTKAHRIRAKNRRKKLYFWGFSNVDERQGIESLGEYLKHPGKSNRIQKIIKADLTSGASRQGRWSVPHPAYVPDKPLANSFDYVMRFQGGWQREVNKLMEIVVDKRNKYATRMARLRDFEKDFQAVRDKAYDNRPTRRRR